MLFVNGLVFCEKEFLDVRVRVLSNTIQEVGKELMPDVGEEVVDLSGGYLLPGLIDVHTHGREGVDFSDADEEAILRVAKRYAACGVTSLLATTMTMGEAETYSMVKRISCAMEKRTSGSRILGINLEGPFLGKEKKGCHDETLLKEVDISYFAKLDECAKGNIKMVAIDPAYPDAMAFIKAYGTEKIISIAHTTADYALACKAAEAGAVHVTHLFNAMNGLNHREPGILGMVFDKPVYAELITDGFHIHPGVIRMMFAMMPEKLCLISDSLSAAGCPEGESILGGLTVFVTGGKATLKDGTLACSTISVYEGMKRCIAYGVQPEAAILAATAQPAHAMKMGHRIGAIKKGLLADLIVTDQAFMRKQVYVGGRQEWQETV